MHLVPQPHGSGLVRCEQCVVFFAVEKLVLQFYEV